MKDGIALILLALCCSAGQRQATIPAGSAIYVDSTSGLDKSLTAAFQSQHLALRVVTSPDQADYTLDSTVMATWDVVRTRSGGSVGDTSEAAVKLTSKSGEVVWRHTISQGTLKRGNQAVAEDCARRLKSIVAKAPKP